MQKSGNDLSFSAVNRDNKRRERIGSGAALPIESMSHQHDKFAEFPVVETKQEI
jgi:hypothetical protein